MFAFTEDTFEQAVIELFENMGYTHIYAPDMNRTDYSRPLLDDVLRDCLVRLNRSLPAVAIDEAILKLNDFDARSLLRKNIIFMDYLQNGITVKYAVKGEERSSVVKLIDYADADKNVFYVVNQYTFVENGNNRRPDIILFMVLCAKAAQNGRSRHLQRRYWRGGNTVRTYKHLTMTDRLRIEKWLKMGMKPREIADKLRVHVSTIYRELKRGAYDRLDGATWEVKTAYSPDIAEDKYQAHLREKGPDLKIGNDHELANYIETTIINKDCSPAAVLGFAMIEGKKFKTSLSVPTIYKYIAKGLFLNLTQEELPRHGKKKHKYKKVKKNKSASRAPAGESIEQRPEEIDEREEFGHWEGDTVYSGKGKRKTTRALLTLTERKTRKEIIIAIPNRKAETVVKALDALERKLGARRFRAIFKSITFDNGTEFAAAEGLERSCVNKRLPRTKVYFCHPYSSWERGTNENTNGMIRRRFPKGTNFAAVTNTQIAQAENWINNYPRKILGYKSSEIVFRECLRELGIAA